MTLLSLFIATKFRKGRQQSSMLSLISVISTLSIALGIAALIIGLSAMNGFERELNHRVLSVIPHGEIYSQNDPIYEWRNIQKQIVDNPHVISVMPYVSFAGLLENGNKMKAVQIEGIDPKQNEKMSDLPKYILNNQWQAFDNDQQHILVGKGLAKQLNVKEGSWVTLLIPSSNGDQHQFKAPKRIRLQVVGIMDFSGELGNNIAIIPLVNAQQYMQIGDSVTNFMVNFSDIYQANYYIQQILFNLDTPLYGQSWQDNYGYMYHDIQMIRQIMYIAMIVVMSVACFSIVSTLVIAVKDKQREIAVFKTLGAPNKLIRRIFIWYGLILGGIGSFVGVILGVIISLQLSNIMMFVERIIGHKLLDSQIYFVDFLPSQISITDVCIVFITSIVLTLLATYYPARRACKVDPVKILNGY